MESVAAFVWNRWQLCRGIGGRIHLESVAALAWNTHLGNIKKKHQKIWGFKAGLFIGESCMLSVFFAEEFYRVKVPMKF